jgi:hypothetical protein
MSVAEALAALKERAYAPDSSSAADSSYAPASAGEVRQDNTRGKLSRGLTTSVEERAKQLLGAGVAAESVAAALGVTPGRISQLLAEQSFSDEVATIRYENLQKHNLRDNNYDTIEDQLIGKLEDSLPMMHKPREILQAIKVINSAKRRGQSAPDQVVNQQNIVNVLLPQIIAERFTVNVDNQVTRAGEQELHTMPATNLLKEGKQSSTS